MTVPSVISLKSVTKSFGPVTALRDVSVDLIEGEFFALLGPSGCGKTTLLRLIAGFGEADGGQILLDGQDMSDLGPNHRPINLMFQSYALFPHMTVAKNIAYGLEMERLDRRDINLRVGEILEQTHLTELSSRKPSQLSGGQKQRVALARALVKRPRVLLLDEPLGALDKKLREQMQLELKRLQHELGITFVVVTHDQEEALVMADRIALMKDGQIAQIDTPRDLYEHPRSRFVAQFIGVTTLLEGHAGTDGIEIEGLGTLSTETTLPTGQPCALSIRPERIRVETANDPSSDNAVEGKITDIAYQGQAETLMIETRARAVPIIARLSARQAGQSGFQIGETVWCHWQAEDGRILTD